MKCLRYQIELLEPVLVTALDGDPNSAVSFNYLPGSVLRGALIGRYLKERKLDGDVLMDKGVQRLFFNGSTRYLDGYPRQGATRSLPTPLSWHWPKGTDSEATDLAVKVLSKEDRTQWQAVGKPFLCMDAEEGDVRWTRIKRQVAVHTQRDREFGRPREGAGAVYRYDALAAGQTFEAAILCDEESDADTLECFLKGELLLGGSRSAGYGRVLLTPIEDGGAESWREAPEDPENDAPDGTLIVTLLSNALVRDRSGQFAADPCVVEAAVQARLGTAAKLEQSFLRGEVVGGFNQKWGLPLPQALSVKMGSVFVFSISGNASDRLTQLLEQGIGERRAEGFGRVAVNWHRRETWGVEPSSGRFVASETISESDAAYQLAQKMVERLLHQRVERVLAPLARRLSEELSGPSRSQLSRLRLAVQAALLKDPEDGRTVLEEYLKSLKDRSTTRRQFEHARVDGKPLLEWLKSRIYDGADEKAAAAIWNDLKFRNLDVPSLGGVTAVLTPKMAYQYNLRLIDAVLARAAKEMEG